MSNFIDEMNAKYRGEEKKNEKERIVRQQEEKEFNQQELQRIKMLIFNDFIQKFKDTILENSHRYIEENGRKHFRGEMLLKFFRDDDACPPNDGYSICMWLYDFKEQNTIFGKKYKFYKSFYPSMSVRLTNGGYYQTSNTLYGQYLWEFSFYSGAGKELCNKLKKEIPTIVFTKGSHSSNIIFDIYI